MQYFSIVSIFLWLRRIQHPYLADAGTYAGVIIFTALKGAVAWQALRISCITQGTSIAALSCIAGLAVTETRQQIYEKWEKT